MAKVILQGNHGTSVSKLALIQKTGFKAANGRLGTGVYFWSDSRYAEYLAQAWWKSQQKQGKYKGDENQSCGIVKAEFKVEEEFFLDLNDKYFKDKLARICQKKKIIFYTNTREAAAIISFFVSELEKTLGHKFKLMETTVAPPYKKYADKYPLQVIGAPNCCIVFDTTCIRIVSAGMCKNPIV